MVEGTTSDGQRILMGVQLVCAVVVTKIMSDVATKSLEEAGVSSSDASKQDLAGGGGRLDDAVKAGAPG